FGVPSSGFRVPGSPDPGDASAPSRFTFRASRSQRPALNARRSPRPRRIVIFGAGGPLAAAAARMIAPHYQLRLTDIEPIEEIYRTGKRQSPTAPLPEPLPPPH